METTSWQEIKYLTDEHLYGELYLGNDCHGPQHYSESEIRRYSSADEVRAEDMWTHFLVIPKVPK